MEQVDEIKKLIKNGENESTEFKLKLSDSSSLAKNLSAIANTNGGKLIVGVNDSGIPVGIDSAASEIRVFEYATSLIDPPLNVKIEPIQIDGKTVLVAEIPKSEDSLHSVKGVLYHRKGHQNFPISSKFIIQDINKEKLSENDLHQKLNILANAVEKLNNEIILMGSWKTKIVDYTIGAIIALIITAIVVFVWIKLFGYNPF